MSERVYLRLMNGYTTRRTVQPGDTHPLSRCFSLDGAERHDAIDALCRCGGSRAIPMFNGLVYCRRCGREVSRAA